MFRWTLDDEDMDHLIRGGTLEFVAGEATLHVSMSDIGYDRLVSMIEEAEGDGETRLKGVRSVV